MLMTVAIIATATAQAQYVTYNHDSPKQNQITVMETGAGSLTPELYYWGITQQIQENRQRQRTNWGSARQPASTSITRRTKPNPSIRHW